MTVASAFTPVGTILAYAGEIDEPKRGELEKSGWLVCDGSSLDIDKYRELYDVIGSNYGQSSEKQYNIPDFRGLFLRGVNGNKGTDPDAMNRRSLYNGGNTGNNVGSYQDYATAPAKNPFIATISKSNIARKRLDQGACVDSSARYGSDNAGGNTDGTGGDLETRPINKYVYYIIKHSDLDQYHEKVQIPIGSVIPFAGTTNGSITQNWIMCDGAKLSNVGEFGKLFAAIGYAHGKEANDLFNLPDYRGYFLRGVDNGARRDPETDRRTAPFPTRPDGHKGNSGDKVGSEQKSATGYPIAADFFTTIPGLPTEEKNPAITGAIRTVYKWNSGIEKVVVTQRGGDAESRPINISVDWYIRFR